jgi:ribonucleoside-triphosphate reductase
MSGGNQFALASDYYGNYISANVDWGPVGYVTYRRTYSRSLDTISERHRDIGLANGLVDTEEWWLTVLRVIEGVYEIQRKHCEVNRLPWNEDKAQSSAQIMYDLIFNFKFTPPGRGLWMMGTPAVDKVGGAALNNCAFVSTKQKGDEPSKPFLFLMDMSMLGVGVGFDVLGAGEIFVYEPGHSGYTYIVDDNRAGWVGALEAVLDAFFNYSIGLPNFDYSLVRPYGSPIMGFGGTASGPQPLIELVDSLIKILTRRIGSTLTSSDIVDIMNLIGRCVVAGNVRRSAELAIGDPNDISFLTLKDYNLYPEECANWRWASNNSVSATVGMDYTDIAERTALNGEPGYIWLDNARRFSRMGRPADNRDILAVGVNPCSEQTLEDKELCCLVDIYPSRHESYAEFERTLKYAYLYGKTVTLVKTHNYETNQIISRNRRIGTSPNGVTRSFHRHGRRATLQWFDAGYEHLKLRDRQYSRWLGVPESIKITSVKPGGSGSLLPGETAGMSYPESEYYYRVIRFDSSSPLVEAHRRAGYMCVDLSPGEPNTTAIYFAVKEKYFKRSKHNVSMWEQLEITAAMQEHWADNQVSATITFTEREKNDIKYALELYEGRLKSISFLPVSNHGYKHAPYQPITWKEYQDYIANLSPVDYSFSRNEIQDKFCDGDKCTI